MSAYIFDTELSRRKEGEIIEAAWLHIAHDIDLFSAPRDEIVFGLPVDGLFCQRYKPERGMHFGSLAIHHILPSELEGCPPSSTFALEPDTSYLIGHSIDTDWTAAGSPANVKRICTHAMSTHVWPDADGYSQVALLYMLLGATESTRKLVRLAHGAEADVINNRILLLHILLARPEITTWSALWLFSEECRIPLRCPLKRWEGKTLDEMDNGAINWCLDQHWLDPYFRIGLERVMEKRYPRFVPPTASELETVNVAAVTTADETEEIPF